MLKKSLVTKYLEHFREVAGNEQTPVTFHPKEPKMLKYDPDRVQTYFRGGVDDDETHEAPVALKVQETGIRKDFLKSSLWLSKQALLPTKQEKVVEHKYGIITSSFKAKVNLPAIRTQTQRV